jgi:hypothetical protein
VQVDIEKTAMTMTNVNAANMRVTNPMQATQTTVSPRATPMKEGGIRQA